MSASNIHLGFDMGIRNLAFCLIDHSKGEDNWDILAWDNVDLLAGGQSSQDSRRCCACSSPAIWSSTEPSGIRLWCKACATGVRRKRTATTMPPFPVLPCAVNAKELKKLCAEKGWDKKSKKEELVALATASYLMPWKAPKATQPSLSHIRQQMDLWLDRMLPTFSSASLIRLENQPVMKGPTMKSIQIILFTLLGHRLEKEHGWRGRIEFVHAGMKTKESDEIIPDVVDGEVDEGKAYRARKKTAETETIAKLVKRGDERWKTFFESRSKKSDLADAFLMALRQQS